MRHLIMLMVVAMCGCGAAGGLLPALAKMGQGAQWLSSVIAAADAGQNAYFDRHPSPERERAIKAALRRARFAVEALDAAVAAAEGANDGDVAKARTEALASYDNLRGLLEQFGVMSAMPPLGGAETDAPVPKPFTLPLRDEVASQL
jgi:hypothetical protein